jgi:hypothetical protein
MASTPGDGSATSGGSGDVIVTEDTQFDTGSGPPNALVGSVGTAGGAGTAGSTPKTADGKILVGDFGQYRGPAGPGNELHIRANRLTLAIERWNFRIVQGLEGIIKQLRREVYVRPKQGASVSVRSVVGVNSSTKLLDRVVGRLGVSLYNDTTCTGNLYVRFGEAAAGNTAGLYSVRLPPGAYYEVPAWALEQPAQGFWDSIVTPGFVEITESA